MTATIASMVCSAALTASSARWADALDNNIHSKPTAVTVKSIEYSVCFLSFLMAMARSMLFTALRATAIATTHNSTQAATAFAAITIATATVIAAATELQLLVTDIFPLWSTVFIDLSYSFFAIDYSCSYHRLESHLHHHSLQSCL